MPRRLPNALLPNALAARRAKLKRIQNVIGGAEALSHIGHPTLRQVSNNSYAASGALKNESGDLQKFGKRLVRSVQSKNRVVKKARRRWLKGYKHKIPLRTAPKSK
jgi:hypothetical protein